MEWLRYSFIGTLALLLIIVVYLIRTHRIIACRMVASNAKRGCTCKVGMFGIIVDNNCPLCSKGLSTIAKFWLGERVRVVGEDSIGTVESIKVDAVNGTLYDILYLDVPKEEANITCKEDALWFLGARAKRFIDNWVRLPLSKVVTVKEEDLIRPVFKKRRGSRMFKQRILA